jgi:hypothetical protein
MKIVSAHSFPHLSSRLLVYSIGSLSLTRAASYATGSTVLHENRYFFINAKIETPDIIHE